MSLTAVTGVHASGNPPAGVALSGSIGIGQVIIAFAAGGGLPGSATVSDNVNSGNYSVLATYPTGNSAMYWKVANASGTPTVSIATTGGFADFWVMGVTGFVGTPTSDTGIIATATATSTTAAINATSNFANEIMLANINYSPTYTQDIGPITGWSEATTGSNHNTNGFYTIEPTPTTNNFSGTITSQLWFLQLAGIYDAPALNVATIAWVT